MRYKTDEAIREREHKDRESLRLWFEDYAITKCIDPLISEILFIDYLTKLQSVESEIEIKQDEFLHQMLHLMLTHAFSR